MSFRRVSLVVIAKEMKRDPRTVKKVIENMNFTRKVRNNIGKGKISPGDMRKIAIVAKKMHFHSSKPILTQLALVEFIVRYVVSP